MIILAADHPTFNSKRLDIFLSYCLSSPLSRIYRIHRFSPFKINNKVASLHARIHTADLITVEDFALLKNAFFSSLHPQKITRRDPSKEMISLIKSSVLFEDDNIIVINKPHNIACQDGNLVMHCIQDFFKYLSNQTLYPVHRIDKDTAGLLVLAKNIETARKLGVKFQNHEIEKEYHAFVSPIPTKNQQQIENDIQVTDGKKIKNLPAQTYYEVIKINPKLDLALVKVVPKTGRKHQIRIHMQSINAPIVGDKKYHGNTKITNKMQLFATKIKISDNMIFSASIESHAHNLMSKLMNCS